MRLEELETWINNTLEGRMSLEGVNGNEGGEEAMKKLLGTLEERYCILLSLLTFLLSPFHVIKCWYTKRYNTEMQPKRLEEALLGLRGALQTLEGRIVQGDTEIDAVNDSLMTPRWEVQALEVRNDLMEAASLKHAGIKGEIQF